MPAAFASVASVCSASRGTEDPADGRVIELEAVGDNQGTRDERHARRDVTNERQGVPVARRVKKSEPAVREQFRSPLTGVGSASRYCGY